MSHFTCITCHVAFRNSEIQREHYKSDWHRYNLKRKVAELPPVTPEVFTQRVLAQKSSQALSSSSSRPEVSTSCSYCGKHFTSDSTYDNHLKSRKHQESVLRHEENKMREIRKINQKNLTVKGSSNETELNKRAACTAGSEPVAKPAKAGPSTPADEEEEEWEEVEGEPIGVKECLFCSQQNSSLEENVKHMTVAHSFFIPNIEYLSDVDELLVYLGEKVGVGNVCLWCNDKGKAFYSVKSVQQHMLDKGHCKMLYEGDSLEEYSDFYDYSKSYPDQPAATGDEDVDTQILEDDGYQLTLPSGATIGHRSLMIYYRQNVPPTRPSRSQKLVHRVMAHYRALGWKDNTGIASARRERDISYMHAIRAKKHMQLGVRHNKLQTHFRAQILM